MTEYQLGNIPDVAPDDLSSIYNQLNLSYRLKNISASTRFELFKPWPGDNNDYLKPTQLKLAYNTKYISLEAGHMYSIFGRGLLLRNYEIPSSIFESRGYRVRHGFYKDLEGFSAKFKSKYINLKLLRGRTLTVDLPPTLKRDERRTDLVEGAEIDGTIKNQTLGIILMRHRNSGYRNDYLSTHYNGNINDLAIYGEIAKRIESFQNISSFSTNDSWAAYVGLNYTWKNLGFSIEYKDYHNFLIGNGVNEPPTLIKEHSWIVLNRSTHVPLVKDESGYQIELYYSLKNGDRVIFNHALSQNNIANSTFTFREYHIDYSSDIGEKVAIRTFVNYSKAPLVSETNRYAVGTLVDIVHGTRLNSSVDIEFQRIIRIGNSKVNNSVFSYTLSKNKAYSVTLLMEVTNDPFIISEEDSEAFYPSVTFGYHFSRKYKLALFAGKRRGGPACTSGVCYEVLDFKGAELRLTSRFL